MTTCDVFDSFKKLKNLRVFFFFLFFFGVDSRGAINLVFHHNGIVHPLCNVIKGPHCMMSSAGAL